MADISLQPWGLGFTTDPLNDAIAALGLSNPGVPFVKTVKVCSLLALMPPIYKLDPSDPITQVLYAIGNSDNDIGGIPCVAC